MKNSPKNCLLAKILIHFMNLALWYTLFYVAFIVVFVPADPIKKFYGLLCIMGLFADFMFMSGSVPEFDNPFKKKSPDYLSDIEAATKEANTPGANLGNLF